MAGNIDPYSWRALRWYHWLQGAAAIFLIATCVSGSVVMAVLATKLWKGH